ncbi:DUF7144 family membrane protein [Actinoallomurus sp. CA-150999]|uniref:DUF7144 family membrane protein n=1 Tax=Actinoallomurus sp. CA-150999 TaxID=3239887 RepID=UPI003D8A531F
MTTPRMTLTSGWLTFAGILVIVTGFFNLIDGLVALLRADYYLVADRDLLILNFTTWGWIWLILGAIQIIVGAGILAGRMWARAAGVVLAVLAALGHLVFLRAFPVWSVLVIAFCVIVVYALTAPPRGSRAA